MKILYTGLIVLALVLSTNPVHSNSGLFSPYVSTPTSFLSNSVAIGDLNGDGRNDIAMVPVYPDTGVYIFLQDTSGTFVSPVFYSVGNGQDVAIGDMNGDGRADAVVSTATGIGVLLQNSSGTLDPMIPYSSANSSVLRIADINNDGRLDVVALSRSSLSIFFQDEGGTLASPTTLNLSDSYFDLAVGDANNDGRKDLVLLGDLFVGVITQTPEGAFNSPVKYNFWVGNENPAYALALGDVNGDGREDIVITVGGPGSWIGVFHQDNTGSFPAHTFYASLNSPVPIVVADVIHDGKNEIVVAHGGWQSLGVYLQYGIYGLHSEEIYPIPYSGYGRHDLAVGDINGDGLTDVVVGGFGHFEVLYQNIPISACGYAPLLSGESWTYLIDGSTERTTTVQPGVFAVNGVLTKLLKNSEGIESYMTNDGEGIREHREYSPPSPSTYGYPATVTLVPPLKYAEAEMRLGQSLSLFGTAYFDYSGFGMYALGYSGSSTVQAIEPVTVPAGTFEAVKLELILTVSGYVGSQYFTVTENQTIWIAQNIGPVKEVSAEGTSVLTGTNFTPAPFSFPAPRDVPLNTVVTSNPVVVSGISAPAMISVTGGEYSINGGPYTAGYGSVTNGQTVTVRVTSSGTHGGAVAAILNIGGMSASFTVTTVISGVSDFNADGKPDIIWRNPSTGQNVVWYMDGVTWTGGYAEILPQVVGTDWTIAGIADFNNDGKPDLLWRNTDTGRTTIWYMDGATWNGGYADVEPTLNDPNWSIVGIADFNRDGSPDLLWRNSSNGRTTIWYMTGPTWNGGYADVEPTLADPNWSIVGIADFNRDGSQDLLWRNSSTGRTTIWHMTGPTWNGGYADVEPTMSDPDWQIVAIRDFNNDGSPDLLWRNTSTYRTTVWYMNGPTWNGNWGDLLPVVSDPEWIIVGR